MPWHVHAAGTIHDGVCGAMLEAPSTDTISAAQEVTGSSSTVEGFARSQM
jgi:hypothetical protein